MATTRTKTVVGRAAVGITVVGLAAVGLLGYRAAAGEGTSSTRYRTVTAAAGTVTIHRDAEGAVEEISGTLPAIVSVTDRTGQARYPSFKSIVAAKKKPVTTWSLADLEIAPDRVGAGASATVVRTLRPSPPREAGTIITDEGDAAERIADFLVANKLL